MKYIFKKAAALALAALLSASVFAGCEEQPSSSLPSSSQIEEPVETQEVNNADLHSLININYDGNEFAGVWIITEGIGSKLDGFAYMFDGNNAAYLMVGTMGYIGTYTMQTETLADGEAHKTFTTQLQFGLDGKYTFEFADDEHQEVTLTNTADNTTTVMHRAAAYEYIPFPDENPVIDEQLVGAWDDGSGNRYYFDSSGVMYEYNKNLSFTFSKYSANGETLTYTYTMKDDITSESQYTVSGDTLTLDGLKYQRISTDKLE